VELPDQVDGFVPLSQLQKEGLRKASDGYKVGDELELMVIEFNKENKKIILSEKHAHDKSLKDKAPELAVADAEAIAEYEKEVGVTVTSGPKVEEPVVETAPTPTVTEPSQPIAEEAESTESTPKKTRKKKAKPEE
jgi:ribosomal protein S1